MIVPQASALWSQFTTFGDLLRFLRRRAGLTQRELSIAVGYSEGQISRLEKNQRPPDIATLTARLIPALCVEDDPAVANRLLELASVVRREDSPAPGLPPFRGLLYFDEGDADLFFGREDLSAALLARVTALARGPSTPRFSAVVGASGSGKSSVVRAGLVPALHWSAPSVGWPIHVMVPTAHPIEALAASLAPEGASPAAVSALADRLAQDARGLHQHAQLTLEHSGADRLLLVVDQFEELFTVCRSNAERQAFVDSLLTATFEPSGRVVVLIALRADFYAQCAVFPRLRDALASEQAYIGAMGVDELRRAIEEPARRGHWELEPGLVELLLKDVASEPGALPLLSHALLETWHRRRRRTLTLSGYLAAGGVRGAIAETAEAVFKDQLTPEQRAIARQIFLRLTELGEEESTADTRRRVALTELTLRPGGPQAVEEVLTLLADARLIITDRESVEVAHEALIREWPTLREWLSDNREGLRLHRHLSVAAQEWDKLRRDESLLYRGARLAQCLEWAVAQPGEPNALESEFLQASRALAERESAEREAQRQRELETARELAAAQGQRAEAERRRAEAQTRAAAQTRRWLLALAGALLVSIAMVVLALSAGRQEKRQATVATARELALAAQSNLALDPELAISLGLQSASAWAAVGQSVPYDLQTTLHEAIQASRARLTWSAGGEAILWAGFIQPGDQPRVVTGDRQAGTVTVWDPVSNQRLLTVPGTVRFGTSGGSSPILQLSPDGGSIAIPGDGNTAKLWDLDSGSERCSLSAPQGEVVDAFFSRDGEWLVTLGQEETTVWDAETCQAQLPIATPGAHSKAAAVSPDGHTLAAIPQEGVIRLWDIASGREVATIQAGFNLTALAFSPDARFLAGAGRENYASVWEVATGRVVANPAPGASVSAQVEAMAYSPDGKRLMIMNGVYEAATAKQLFLLLGHTKPVSSLEFSSDGSRVITGSYDGTVKVWDVGPTREVLTLVHPSGWIYDVAFSPDGTRLATAGEDQTAIVWELASGKKLQVLKGHIGVVNNVAFSPGGALLATAGADRAVMVWDARSGQRLRTLTGFGEDRTGIPDVRGVYALAFSPRCGATDGAAARCPLAAAGHDGRLAVWDALTGETLFTYQDPDQGLMSVAFSPDGTRLALGNAVVGGGDSWTTIFDVASGTVMRTLPSAAGWVWGVAFSPDGRRLATMNFYGDGRVWDVESGQALAVVSGVQDGAYSVAFHPSGSLLAVGSAGYVLLADANSGLPLMALPGHQSLVVRSTFSRDGKYLATASFDGTARVYVVSPDDLLALARSRLTRVLTAEECRQYLHTATCPPP